MLSGVTTFGDATIKIISVRDPAPRRKVFLKAEDFDKAFDDGAIITPFLDLNKTCRKEVFCQSQSWQ